MARGGREEVEGYPPLRRKEEEKLWQEVEVGAGGQGSWQPR